MPKSARFIVLDNARIKTILAPRAEFRLIYDTAHEGVILGYQVVTKIENGFEVTEYTKKEMDDKILATVKCDGTCGGSSIKYLLHKGEIFQVQIRFGANLTVDFAWPTKETENESVT